MKLSELSHPMNHPLPESAPITTASFLWNPFRTIAGLSALGWGLAILLITGGIASLSRTHFDGVLDTHLGHSAPLWFFLGEGVINWLSAAIFLCIGGTLLTGFDGVRSIDLFGTQALARAPFLLTALICLLPGVGAYNDKLIAMASSGKAILLPPPGTAGEITSFYGAVIVMLLVTIWFVALAWKSFRVSCDVRGWKAICVFIIAIIGAEVLSKVAIVKGLVALLP